mmetsp:Transcript_103360/g.287781  ORF Transcript_103360/g.287781 Transcript_103360/m.287781 type:complete len:89 (-) Transcript_103360:138-404(-)
MDRPGAVNAPGMWQASGRLAAASVPGSGPNCAAAARLPIGTASAVALICRGITGGRWAVAAKAAGNPAAPTDVPPTWDMAGTEPAAIT